MTTQESLSMALSVAGCRDLPKAYNHKLNLIWIKAITLVQKKNGKEEYVISEQRASGLINHICDCGTMSPIGSVIRFYPFMYLDDGIKKSCEGVLKEFLALKYPDKADSIFSATDEELEIYRTQYAIDLQKEGNGGYVENSPLDAVEAAESALNEEIEPSAEPQETIMIQDEGDMILEEVTELKPAKKRTRKTKK